MEKAEKGKTWTAVMGREGLTSLAGSRDCSDHVKIQNQVPSLTDEVRLVPWSLPDLISDI